MTYEKKINDYLKKAQINFDLAGLTAGIWVDDDSNLNSAGLSLAGAYGKADIKTNTDLEPTHFSHMASISKTLTACAALKLVEDGKLKFEDKLCDLLPWLSMDDSRFKDITFKHMITHTSGLPGVTDFQWTNPDIDVDAIKRFAMSDDVKKAKFVNTPGESIFSYSDMAFDILGRVISEISGVSYEEYVTEHLLKPAGMNDSTMLVHERTEFGRSINANKATREEINKALDMDDLLNAGLAMPHMKDDSNVIIRQPYYPYNRRHAPSSTLNTNIFDIKKWGHAHMERRLLKPETYDIMFETQTIVQNNGEGMGLGWFIREQNGYTLYGHEGMDDGFRASFWMCPKLKAQIVVLANIGKAPVKKISRQLFDFITDSGI